MTLTSRAQPKIGVLSWVLVQIGPYMAAEIVHKHTDITGFTIRCYATYDAMKVFFPSALRYAESPMGSK